MTPAPGPRPLAPAFVLAGGGTGGHVIPLLAVARELRRRGKEVVFVGTARGIESRLVPAEGFRLELIEIGGLKGVGPVRIARTLWQLPSSTWQCRSFVGGASAVFSMGGYAAGPPVMSALLRRVPVVIMEPNAVPGFTNRRIASFVKRALISFPETARYFPEGRTEITGLPVRDEFFAIQPKPRGEVFTVLITGGSQGSRTLNRAVRASWPLFRESGLRVSMILQTGRAQYEECAAAFAASGVAGEVTAFLSDMPAAFAAADLVISRSGAGAVTELAAAGKPSVLVPFPFAADNHQLRNAEAMARAGAAQLIADAEMTGERLFAAVRKLASDAGELERMGDRARALAKPGAAARATDILEEVSAHDFR